MACRNWVDRLRQTGRRIIIAEIIDYEVRRELLRRRSTTGLVLLDSLALQFEYLPLTTWMMRQAAELWAHARSRGRPTASPKKIDADLILIAQALSLQPATFVVATSNVRHFTPLVHGELWENIQ